MNFGKGLFLIALPWFLVERTGDVQFLALLMIGVAVQDLFTSPVVGVLVDRFPRKYCAALADVMRGILVAGIAVFSYYSSSLYFIIIISILYFFFDRLNSNSVLAMVPDIVKQEFLLKTNARLQFALQGANLSGAVIGGALINFLGAPVAFGLISLAFFASSILFFVIPYGFSSKKSIKSRDNLMRSTLRYFISDVGVGLKTISKNKHITRNLLSVATLFIVLDVTNSLLPYFVATDLRLNAFEFGLIDASWAVGAGLISLFLFEVFSHRAEKLIQKCGFIFLAMLFIIFSQSDTLSTAIIFYFALGAVFAAVRVVMETESHRLVPADARGKVRAAAQVVISLGTIATYMILLIMQTWLAAAELYLIATCLCGGVVLLRWILHRDNILSLADDASGDSVKKK